MSYEGSGDEKNSSDTDTSKDKAILPQTETPSNVKPHTKQQKLGFARHQLEEALNKTGV